MVVSMQKILDKIKIWDGINIVDVLDISGTKRLAVDIGSGDINVDLDKDGDSVAIWTNTAKDGSGTDYQPLVDSDGHLQVDILSGAFTGDVIIKDVDITSQTTDLKVSLDGEVVDVAQSGTWLVDASSEAEILREKKKTELLFRILGELEKMNMHLAMITQEDIDDKDLEDNRKK